MASKKDNKRLTAKTLIDKGKKTRIFNTIRDYGSIF